MAIEQDVIVLIGKQTKSLRIANADDSYSSKTFLTPDRTIPINNSTHEWTNYVLAGYKGVLEHLGYSSYLCLDLLVSGSVPQGSGLSSSSALVSAVALGTAYACQADLSLSQLAEISSHSERYIGLEGGGMDQAISFLGTVGYAKMIEFEPLRCHEVKLPSGVVFVVAHCGVSALKYLSASSGYNLRVVECKLAALVIAVKLKISPPPPTLKKLAEALNKNPEEMVTVVTNNLTESSYELSDVARLVGEEESVLKDKYCSKVSYFTFALRQRALHVYSEASRVLQFRSICDQGKPQPHSLVEQENPSMLNALGSLMNSSHESCASLYECSSPPLDRLVHICREAGALGSRLTGAGWGGCTVSMVPQHCVKSFKEHVIKEYYQGYLELKLEDVEKLIFSSFPSSGAAVVLP